jgi:RES domain-containing protein
MLFTGRVWRHIPAGAAALHLGKIWKYSAGRWNRRGEYACLYTALTREGALAELEKLRLHYGSAMGSRELVSIDIHRLDPVLDLTDLATYAATARGAGEHPNAALLTADGDATLEHCRMVADQARTQGCTGLLVPSAALRGAKNLVVYFDVVAPKQLDIDDGPDREVIP